MLPLKPNLTAIFIMSEKFYSKALEANLAETRYKDIVIPEHLREFISLSEKYYGINKRAQECIIEYLHPFSNRLFRGGATARNPDFRFLVLLRPR
jgi:hypothetical protein